MLRKRNVHKNNAARRFAGAKAQSAMEYLMTYGWAILIIAVVLGALFQLGVFNANNFAPKAPPGACQVFRPNGPGTTSFINLEGVCSGELPQYVSYFSGTNFGTDSYISFSPDNVGSTSFSVSFWLQSPITSSVDIPLFGNQYTENDGQANWEFEYDTRNMNGCGPVSIRLNDGTTPAGSGEFVSYPVTGHYATSFTNFVAVVSLTSKTVTWYVDDVVTNVCGGPAFSYNGIFSNSNSLLLGTNGAHSNYFPGEIANVQIYNTSLSANEIQALYLEGIGGAPINLQHLVGWWPLNGNANDYSGNGNNGQINNVNFVSNWWSSYTPP